MTLAHERNNQSVPCSPIHTIDMHYRALFLVVVGSIGGWYLLSFWSNPRTSNPQPADSGKPSSGVPTHNSDYSFTPIAPTPVSPDPPGSNPNDQDRLDRLIRSIEQDGRPKRDQGILELRAFLSSNDPRVRLEAATMLYEMKDRSGYATLLELVQSPGRVPGRGGLDLRESAGRTFARYRERWAGDALLSLFERTKSLELKPQALTLRLSGIVPYLHESLRQRTWVDSIEGLAMLEPQSNQPLFRRIADNDQQEPRSRAAAIFGLAMAGDAASLERLIAVVTNPSEALPGNHDDLGLARGNAAAYLTNFRGERVVKVFEDMLTWKKKDGFPGIALVYLRYRYPQNQPSREIVKAGLQPGGEASVALGYTELLRLARLSGDPELIALGRKMDYFTSFRELEVRAGWSNAWIGEILPDWEGDW